MASELVGFEKHKDFLVCVDSDGCAMDTMDVKHEKAFCPQLIRVFGLEQYADFITPYWMEVNLFSATRGVNRFKGMLMTFEALKEKGVEIPHLAEIAQWVNNARELSNPNLENEIAAGNTALKPVLEWSLAVNKTIRELPQDDKPFKGVKEGLAAVHLVADTAVVSSANAGAIQSEWNRHGLAQYMNVMLGQEVGSKAACIHAMAEGRYDKDKVLMVGDALGDLDAAQKNGVLFYPILVGREEESWKRLAEEAIHKLLHGIYRGAYQEQLIKEQRSILK
ncbi:MAG TPA: HAD hydrolase-like protein [Candidatus Anaerofilum excrementigallinarum]|nr:HAD hydrolase-like protein [Candidatus Anaerofilum excrementigallinarum]